MSQAPLKLRAWSSLCRAFDDVSNAGVVFPRFQPYGEAPQPAQVRDDLGRCVRQRAPATAKMAQCQRTIAVAVKANDLHVGNTELLRVLLCKQLA